MNLLPALQSARLRQAASVVITVGPGNAGIGVLAPLVSAIEVRNGRNDTATATITVDDRRESDGRWMAADAGLFARWTPIRIEADFHTHEEEVFRGYITELKPQLPENGGDAKLVIECMDQGAGLSREHRRELWKGTSGPMTDLDILRVLVAPLGLEPRAGCGVGQSSRNLSMDGPAIVFLRDRARANGYELIFSSGQVWFGPKRIEAAPQPTILLYAGTATNCLSFSVSDSALGPDAVIFEHAPRSQGSTPIVEKVVPNLPLLGRTSVASEGAALGAPSLARLSREGDETEEETRSRAQAMANDASFRVQASGELDGTLYGHVLSPGLPVRVDGAGERNGGLYYVDTVTHVFTPDGYRQQFKLIRNATGDAETLAVTPLSGVMSAIATLF